MRTLRTTLRGLINFPSNAESTPYTPSGKDLKRFQHVHAPPLPAKSASNRREAMSKPPTASTLYRLIEAGHLARQALMAPLQARGLEAGDDAVLLGIADPEGVPMSTLEAFTGIAGEPLETILRRLEDKGLLLRLAVGPEMVPGARLSQQGQATRAAIEDHWRQLEDTIAADLGKKTRKSLRTGLKRIITLLDF